MILVFVPGIQHYRLDFGYGGGSTPTHGYVVYGGSGRGDRVRYDRKGNGYGNLIKNGAGFGYGFQCTLLKVV